MRVLHEIRVTDSRFIEREYDTNRYDTIYKLNKLILLHQCYNTR